MSRMFAAAAVALIVFGDRCRTRHETGSSAPRATGDNPVAALDTPLGGNWGFTFTGVWLMGGPRAWPRWPVPSALASGCNATPTGWSDRELVVCRHRRCLRRWRSSASWWRRYLVPSPPEFAPRPPAHPPGDRLGLRITQMRRSPGICDHHRRSAPIVTVVGVFVSDAVQVSVPVAVFWPKLLPSAAPSTEGPTAQVTGGGFESCARSRLPASRWIPSCGSHPAIWSRD